MAITNVSSSTKITAAPSGGTSYRSAFAMVTTLFFMWGFLTSLNDILIPHLKAYLRSELCTGAAGQFAFFSAYAAFGVPRAKWSSGSDISEPWSWACSRWGWERCYSFLRRGAVVPALPHRVIVLAAGITSLQVAANPYVSVLGPPQTASSRLNLTQAFNSLGTVIGPPLGGWLILAPGCQTSENPQSLSPAALHAYRLQQAALSSFLILRLRSLWSSWASPSRSTSFLVST